MLKGKHQDAAIKTQLAHDLGTTPHNGILITHKNNTQFIKNLQKKLQKCIA